MNLWLDDERPMPADYQIHAKTAEEAITALQTGEITKISLDHDLGVGKTGYDVACWIEMAAKNGTLKKLRLRVHTQNPVGRKNICMALQNAEKYWREQEESPEKSLKTLLEWCRHKGAIMFGEKDLNSLWNFLQGYRFARDQFNIFLTAEEVELDRFDNWVRDKLRGSPSKCWATIIQEKYGKDAWDKFYTLLDEYRVAAVQGEP